jgi:hypothetical protein
MTLEMIVHCAKTYAIYQLGNRKLRNM